MKTTLSPSQGIHTPCDSLALPSESVFFILSLSAHWNAGGSKPLPSPPDSLSNCKCMNQLNSK